MRRGAHARNVFFSPSSARASGAGAAASFGIVREARRARGKLRRKLYGGVRRRWQNMKNLARKRNIMLSTTSSHLVKKPALSEGYYSNTSRRRRPGNSACPISGAVRRASRNARACACSTLAAHLAWHGWRKYMCAASGNVAAPSRPDQ